MQKVINDSRVILFIDVCIVFATFFFAYLLRFNFQIPNHELDLFKINVFVFLIFRIVFFLLFHTHKLLFKYTSIKDAYNIFKAIFSSTLVFFLINAILYFIKKQFLFPTSVLLIEFVFASFALMAYRILIRNLFEQNKKNLQYAKPIVIFGAGEAGVITIKSLKKETNASYQVLAFFDDDKNLSGKKIEDIPVFNTDDELIRFLEKSQPESLIIAVLNISSKRKNELAELCLQHQVKVLNVPHTSKWIDGSLTYKQLKEIAIEDLLERDPILLDSAGIKNELNGKTILITGASGSIGSEIARQILSFEPNKLLLLDQAETPLHDLQLELNHDGSRQNIEIIIGDIVNKARIEKVFETYQPHIVFHGAAYKHVPLMEDNPSESILTNIIGTKILADLSNQFLVEKFVLISTDKAVNPTNIMGCTKRIAEMYCQTLSENRISKTKFITTRFGNVLGSNGSVIPLFKKQIENGGPVTITDAEITRYFMTIPEACQLVLEACYIGNGNEIFVFDMGELVKINDLALKMIKMSGKVPGKDIQIVYTGLRPGEKLFEELLTNEENTTETHHPKIKIGKRVPFDKEVFLQKLDLIQQNISLQDNMKLVKYMKEMVPEYISNNSIYSALDE